MGGGGGCAWRNGGGVRGCAEKIGRPTKIHGYAVKKKRVNRDFTYLKYDLSSD